MSANTYQKLIDEIGKMSVIELADFIKALQEALGVSAAMMASGAPAQAASAEAAPAQEEKSSYKVELTDGGPEKIKSIKALRSVTTLGLTEAKALVEGLGVIAESASKEDAKKIKEAMEAAGAKVKLS